MVYDYECQMCKHTFEEVRKVNDRYDVTCPKCDATDVKILITNSKNRDWFRPHWNEHITGEPVFIESRSQLKRLCLENNVTSRALGDVRNYHHLHGGERGY